MKAKLLSFVAVLPYVFILLVISVFPATLVSQQSTVRWSTFDMGFAMSVSSNTLVKSAIGQGFVGTIQQGNTRIESGLFAITSIRGTITSAHEIPCVPSPFSLKQNFPNPFNPSTSIEYVLPKGSFVSLRIYNVLGEEVATLVNEVKAPGTHKNEWRGNGCSSGVYFYRLSVVPSARRDLDLTKGRDGQAGAFVETKKLILLR